jgi:transcription elongation factor Elf1
MGKRKKKKFKQTHTSQSLPEKFTFGCSHLRPSPKHALSMRIQQNFGAFCMPITNTNP